MKDKIKAILLIIMVFSAEICHAGELWKVPITKAMAFHLEMKEDASVRAQKERGIKNQIKIWATCKETSERLQSQYYRLDAIRYNAQQIFEWQDTYPKETDMYKDAKDAESQWLFLMNQVSSRLGIARTECKKKWTTPAVELGRARRHWRWSIEDKNRAMRNKRHISIKYITHLFDQDADKTVMFAKEEVKWGERIYQDMARYMYSISDAAIDERLDLAYKQADEYLNKVIAAHKAKKRLEDELYESLQIKKIKEVMEEWNRIQALMDAMRGVYRKNY
jgi:hypothetical protein